MDAREGEVLIAVYHNENSLNLYISDETGLFYSLTLEGVIANDGVKWDAGNGVFDVHVVWVDTVQQNSKHVDIMRTCCICWYIHACAS